MKRNKFSLSHYKLLTCDMGKLIPVTWFEALPGDSIQHATSMLLRLTPLVAPVMHPVRIRLHTFFVPNRLIWEDWENFITGGEDGTFEAAPPQLELSNIAESSLADYLDVPAADYTGNLLTFSMLPIRAYQLIYNNFYRDQDLVDEVTISLASGTDTTTSRAIQNVSWEKDLFTTARPWTSKGNEVLIPIGDTAPVVAQGGAPVFTAGAVNSPLTTEIASSSAVHLNTDPSADSDLTWNDPNLVADLSQATGISVNDLRNYLAQQRFQEARAQFGSRYSEYLKYLVPGIGNLDSRLQEPEYISGGSATVSFSEILQTQRTDEGETPLGTMAGHGISAMRTKQYRRFFQEHGIVMTLMSVVPKAIYSQGLNKKFFRFNKDEYYQRELEYVGEQPILNQEVYSLHSNQLGTFGYAPQYESYRYHPSGIAGGFRTTQDSWHYARIHTGDVALNQSFIECVPSKRPSVDQVSHVLYVMTNHSIQARRILSKWSKPKTF